MTPKITLQSLLQWLSPAMMLPNSPMRADIKAACSVILLAVDDMPASLLTAGTMREGLRAWRFWPSPAEVRSILQPHYDDLRQSVALRSPPPARLPPPPREKSDAERAYVTRIAAELRADLLAQEQATLKAYRRPALTGRQAPTLSRATLNSLYERQGLRGPPVAGD